MKKTSYWLAGALTMLAALAVAAVAIRQAGSGSSGASVAPPVPMGSPSAPGVLPDATPSATLPTAPTTPTAAPVPNVGSSPSPRPVGVRAPSFAHGSPPLHPNVPLPILQPPSTPLPTVSATPDTTSPTAIPSRAPDFAMPPVIGPRCVFCNALLTDTGKVVPYNDDSLPIYHCTACDHSYVRRRDDFLPVTNDTLARLLGDTPPVTPSAAASSDASVAPSPAPAAESTPSPSPGGLSVEEVNTALARMDLGEMAYDVPQGVRVDETVPIHLLLSPRQAGQTSEQVARQLTDTLSAQSTRPVKIEAAQVRLTGLVQARLDSGDFDVKPITPERQVVSASEPTEWKWQIHPHHAGRLMLTLTLDAFVTYQGKEYSRTVRTLDREVQVEVAPADPATRLPGWLLPAGGLLALAALAGATFLLRRGRRGIQPSPAPVRPPDGEAAELFVSYSRRDQERALAFVGRLQAVGYKVWIDQRGIDGATLWAQEISEAIRRAKVCVLFASAASFGSPNVTREISLACEEGKSILPLLLEPASVPSALRYQLAGIQHIELFRGEAEENFQKVLRALERLGVARPVATDAR